MKLRQESKKEFKKISKINPGLKAGVSRASMTDSCLLPYSKPGPVGGKLIREVIGFLKSQNTILPLHSHILIALSGGSDSVGLAHLLIHFGKRIVPRENISFLHVNHGWRGEESEGDERFVQELGKKWKIPVMIHRIESQKQSPLDSPIQASAKRSSSLEEEAREFRKEIFLQEANRLKATVFTAHQADDLAETVLWRLLTGAAQSHGGGIAFRHGVEMRPFLTIRKSLIKTYLAEVSQEYREDATNQDERFLRARMRKSVMPALEQVFPRAVNHLTKLALSAQSEVRQEDFSGEVLPEEMLIQAAGLKLRRPHFELFREKLVANSPWSGEIHLPGGWKLTSHASKKWILEQISSSKEPS